MVLNMSTIEVVWNLKGVLVRDAGMTRDTRGKRIKVSEDMGGHCGEWGLNEEVDESSCGHVEKRDLK